MMFLIEQVAKGLIGDDSPCLYGRLYWFCMEIVYDRKYDF